MQSYFLDVIGVVSVQLDFHGQSMGHANDALRRAEIIALDFESRDLEWSQTQIEVRTDDGDRLYSVNVRHPNQIVW